MVAQKPVEGVIQSGLSLCPLKAHNAVGILFLVLAMNLKLSLATIDFALCSKKNTLLNPK